MKKIIYIFFLTFLPFGAKSTIHEILVWDGYMQFLPSSLEVELGDTIQWLPLDYPSMVHTVTSSNIPNGAVEFDVIWQAPADTFFQYIPAVIGLYEYVCTPHIQYDMIASFNVVEAAAGMVESEQNDFAIYPNPANDILFIKTSETKVSYKLWTQSGTQVGEGMVSNKIDISKLSKGSYYIEIIGVRPRLFSFTKN
jgi:plastocyanin